MSDEVMSDEVMKVIITEKDEADIVREVLNSDICQIFTKKEPFYMLVFVQMLGMCFNKIRERSRMHQVADILKGDNND